MRITTITRLLLSAVILLATAGTLPAATTTIKVAVVTPEGSAWVQVLEQMLAEVKTQTQGAVDSIMYAGGVSGDEADVLRKMQIDRLQAAGLSGVGLGILLPEIRVLETPLLFRNDAEIDAARERMFDYFAAALEKKGYILLGFTEGGWVDLFSDRNIAQPEAFKDMKMWVWEGDRVAEGFLKACGVRTTPLHVADVNTGLETGMIDSFYAPPLAAVAFQWFTRIHYMLDLPVTNALAGLIMTKRAMQRLTPDQQEILKQVARKYSRKLVELTRRDNREALSILQAQGVQVVAPAAPLLTDLEAKAREASAASVPDVYPQDLVDRVRRIVMEVRSGMVPKN